MYYEKLYIRCEFFLFYVYIHTESLDIWLNKCKLIQGYTSVDICSWDTYSACENQCLIFPGKKPSTEAPVWHIGKTQPLLNRIRNHGF